MKRTLEATSLWLMLGLGMMNASNAFAEDKLAVFVPTVEHSKEIEKSLQKDPALSNLKVTAFANFDDFQSSVKAADVTYAIVPFYYTKYYPDLEPIFQFTDKGASTFKYLVISLDPAWTKEKLAEGTAGIVNMVGRDKTKLYSEELLPGKKFKRIKQVSKVTDLFPLLSLGNAQYALFDPKDLMAVLKDFNSKPLTIVETIEVSYPVLTVKKGKTPNPKDDFSKIKAESLKDLGLDGISPIKK